MSAIFQVARTEILEHRRQPWMLLVLVLNYLLWTVVPTVLLTMLDTVASNPATRDILHQQLATAGLAGGEDALRTVLGLLVSTVMSILLTNLPLFVAIMSGYSVLHDRDQATLPFLMLAPVSRSKLLGGKLLGAMAFPVVLHLVFVGLATLLLSRLSVLAPFSHQLGGSGAWWVAYLVGTPAAAVLVGALGTVISGLSRDVRTSMQFTSFFIGLLSLAFGFVLVDSIPAPDPTGATSGVAVQIAFAVVSVLLGLATLVAGAKIISRDINPM